MASDRAGDFGALLFPAGYRLTASRPGYVLRRAPTVDARGKAGPEPAKVVLELVRGARVFGKVVDPRGATAAGARVRCLASAIEDLTVQIGPLPLAAEAASMPSGAGRALGTTRAAVADRDGRFVIDDLIPGRYRVEVAHGGAEPFRSDEFVLAPGERRDVGKLALQPGFPVTGRVVDESGCPIDGARVVVGAGGASAASAGLVAVTDAGGSFALSLPAGSYRLAASAPGRGRAEAAVDVAAGSSPPALQIKLVRAEATLEGLVRDDGGRPLARARLAVWPADALEPGATPDATPIASGVADVGGHFRLTPLPAGDARLEIRHPDYPTSVHAVTAGKYANLTVPFPGGIAGEVKAKITGAAIARGRLEAVGPGGAKATRRREAGRHVSPSATRPRPLAADRRGDRLPQRRAGAGGAPQLEPGRGVGPGSAGRAGRIVVARVGVGERHRRRSRPRRRPSTSASIDSSASPTPEAGPPVRQPQPSSGMSSAHVCGSPLAG